MAVLASFDFSPGKPAVNTTVSGTSAQDDSIDVPLLLSVLLTQLDTQLSCRASHNTGDYFSTRTKPLGDKKNGAKRSPPML